VNWDEAAATDRFENDRLHAAIWAPTPHVVVTRLRGAGGIEFVRVYTAAVDRVIGRVIEAGTGDRVRVFHHWAEVERYERDARSSLRTWAVARAAHLSDAHYLVRSSVQAFVISAAALALRRRLVSYTDEARFEEMLEEALRADGG
jgi:hypothetical protein